MDSGAGEAGDAGGAGGSGVYMLHRRDASRQRAGLSRSRSFGGSDWRTVTTAAAAPPAPPPAAKVVRATSVAVDDAGAARTCSDCQNFAIVAARHLLALAERCDEPLPARDTCLDALAIAACFDAVAVPAGERLPAAHFATREEACADGRVYRSRLAKKLRALAEGLLDSV